MPEQIYLFTPAIEHKQKALDAIKLFNFHEAKTHLEIAHDIDPYLADLNTLAKAAQFMLNLDINPKTTPTILAEAWEKVNSFRATQARTLNKLLESLICERVIQLLPQNYCDYIDANKNCLHIGYCHLFLNQPEKAHAKLLDYLTSHADEGHTKLWGYFGDASYKLNQWKETNSGYLRALFTDSQSVDLDRLQHPQLRWIYNDLCKQHPENKARALLPIHSWLQGVLYIPAGNVLLSRFVQQYKFNIRTESQLTPAHRYHQFALCLYIDQSGLHCEIDFNPRVEMQRLDAALFQQYLDAVRKLS